jgi:starch synthase
VSSWFLERAVRRTSLFVPFSNYTASAMLSVHDEVAGRVHVLHPGLPIERWPQREPPTRSDRFRVLFVGGNAVLKGIDTLLTAFEQSLRDTCTLSVATQRAFLPDELEAQMESAPWVQLHLDLQPGSPELRRLFLEADAFVLPSRYDPSSWVALEAMATGVPVVITGVGGIPDIVRDGETGLVIEPDSPDDIVAAIRRLEHDPELVDRLVVAGRRHVVENFDVETNTARLLAMTKQLVDERRGQPSPAAGDDVESPADGSTR